mmetsp:Transcript_246/g.772  ORF Transcript_246/g.772 Transcript_246/m.772 type:complete len:831 (+) Transcript_246:153-2645(+)|eukprot:CAMPEP_0117654566 /NCGR_PEP_ID=MMETSP0804-20121206/3812_1 /TAXON_ID=1074897 /ORGANISM="Tetraselmis astigmatica, Strain CCMP880" /LENGTH=830 /DNA_ID=CAMNT_0005460855 /DNA_START=142 /DNA_END=2634 /DNA_ORIENTATION=+
MGSQTRTDDDPSSLHDSFEAYPDLPRMPATVAVALLKDAAARAAYVRSELAAMKATQISLMSPGRDSPGGSPGTLSPNLQRFHTTTSYSSSPSTARTHHQSFSSTSSPHGPNAAPSHTYSNKPDEPKFQASQAYLPGSSHSKGSSQKGAATSRANTSNKQRLERKISSARYPPKEQSFEAQPRVTPETARARILQRMKNVNAAMDEICKKRSERSNTSLDSSNISHRAAHVRTTQQTSPAAASGSTHAAQKPVSMSGTKLLSPPHASSSPIPPAAVEVQVMETHVSLASLMQAGGGSAKPSAAPSSKRQAAPRQGSKPKPRAAVQPTAGTRSHPKPGRLAAGAPASGYAAKHSQRKPKKQPHRKNPRPTGKGSSPQDSGLGPWNNTKLDESVSVLLATVDKKIARDYENLSSRHQKRSSAISLPNGSTSASVRAESAKQPSVDASFDGLLSDASDRDQTRLLQPTWGHLVPNEGSMPPSPDPFYTCDPEELARQLYPDDSSASASQIPTPGVPSREPIPAGSPSMGQAAVSSSQRSTPTPQATESAFLGGFPVGSANSRHTRTSSKALFQMDGAGDPPIEDSMDPSARRDPATPDNSFASSPGGPSRVASPNLPPVDTPEIPFPEQSVGPLVLVSSLLGDSRSNLSIIALDEVVSEVARGTYMGKRKCSLSAMEPASSGSKSGGPSLMRRLSQNFSSSHNAHPGSLSSGSKRRVQLILDNRRALLAYKRGGFRGTIHGRVTSVQAAGGSWKSSDEITVVTDSYTFHLIPMSAREYYVWIMALNFSLHYLEGAPIDNTISAADIPLHPRFKTSTPVMVSSLAQWANTIDTP